MDQQSPSQRNNNTMRVIPSIFIPSNPIVFPKETSHEGFIAEFTRPESQPAKERERFIYYTRDYYVHIQTRS